MEWKEGRQRVACIVKSRNAKILNLQAEIERMGWECRIFPLDSFTETQRYWRKKWVELLGNKKQAFRDFSHQRQAQIVQEILMYRPQKCLIINALCAKVYVQRLLENMEVVCWLIDPVRLPVSASLDTLRMTPVFVYERESQKELTKYGIFARYCPVGYQSAYERESVMQNTSLDIDIAFVGTPYPLRRHLLDALAKAADQRGWNLQIFGPFYEQRYFWKRWTLSLWYPHLMRHLLNGSVPPETAADIYQRSKICLNIHGNGSTGVNPRTFEILACGAMEMVDVRGDYDILRPGVDFAVFDGADELIKKTEWYLSHNEERAKLAASGHARVRNVRSMKHCLQDILGDVPM